MRGKLGGVHVKAEHIQIAVFEAPFAFGELGESRGRVGLELGDRLVEHGSSLDGSSELTLREGRSSEGERGTRDRHHHEFAAHGSSYGSCPTSILDCSKPAGEWRSRRTSAKT